MALYAAYGSNCDPAQMLERCPHSPAAGTGWLEGWRLTFGGEDLGWEGALATIVEAPGQQVFVALYDVTEFDIAQLESFLNRVEQFHIPIVAGIWPLLSLRNAEFLANEVPGVSVPDTVLARMRKASDGGKDSALAEGVKIAREMFALVKRDVQGIQVSAPFGKVEVALEVFK